MKKIKKLSYLLVLFTIDCLLGINGSCQVDLSTGKALMDIPLYSYSNVNNRLSLNINLHYEGGGIKVEDVASNVGLGWQVEYGGYIKRIQKNKPDDEYPDGILYNGSDHLNDCPTINGWNPVKKCTESVYVPRDDYDREHDLFEFNFNGKKGAFIIGTDGEIMTLVNSDLKITKYNEDLSSLGIITRISKFEITTSDGIKYIFSDKEYNEGYKYAPGYSTGGNFFYYCNQTPPKPDIIAASPTGKYVVNTWRLTDIINPLTNETIHFTYESYSLDFVYSTFGYRSYYNDNSNDATELYGGLKFTGVLKRIKEISLPGNEMVFFKYDQSKERNDLLGDRALTEISVIRDEKGKFSYVFNYQYFSFKDLKNYENQSGYDPNIRLSLASVNKMSNGLSSSPYIFEYYLGGVALRDYVPPRNYSVGNNPAGRDHWGYYNGGVLDVPGNNGNHQPNIDFTINGSLKKVTYPTKGSLTFEYEANQAVDENGQVQTVGGIRVKDVTIEDGINSSNIQQIEYHYTLSNGQSSGYGYEHPEYNKTTNLFTAIPSSGNYEFIDAVEGSAYSLNLIGTLKSGPTLGAIAGNALSSFAAGLLINLVINTVIDAFSPDYKERTLHITTASTQMNTFTNSLPSGYSRTEVIRKNSTGETIGKIVYEFSSDKDVPYLYPSLPASYPEVQRRAGWLYGLPQHISVYDSQNKLIKQTINIYHYIQNTSSNYSFASKKCTFSQSLTTDADGYNTYKNRIGFFTTEFYPVTGRAELVETISKDFDTQNNYIESRVKYEYDPDTYLLKNKIVTNSTGETLEKRIYYPDDYSLTGTIQSMKDNNMIAFPVETETLEYNGTENPKIIAASIIDYQFIASGDIKPVKLYRLTSDAPVPEGTLGTFDPSKLNQNTVYFKEDGIMAYDANGALVQTYIRGRIASQIYDYDHQYLTATVKNAASAEIAYTSFETDEKGNWQYSGIPEPVNTAVPVALTGEKYYDLSKGALTRSAQGLTIGKHYKLTYWTKNGSAFQLNYSSSVTKGSTVQGWTYFQHIFTAGSSNVVLSGSGPIDEVRLYPADARMVTTAYKPLIGKTGECDAANQLLYYQYDELGRPLFILDENRNIIQKMTYHEAGQSTAGTIYYSQPKSQPFTKNNCATGYTGSSVTYTVPAEKYFSTVSPEYAQAQAQADIDANGQGYANAHGGCIANNLSVSQRSGSYNTRPFTVTITNPDTHIVVFQHDFEETASSLPYSGNIPAGFRYRVQIDAMNPITASVNGDQETIQGSRTWLYTTAPINIEVWFNP